MQHLKKSKRSAVIAERLFEYISLIGPRNSWVSDHGREFMDMCTNFSKIIGTEHLTAMINRERTKIVGHGHNALRSSIGN
jgi:hypothetical protein